MKTMDNRIQVDEETLKQFQTDTYVTEMMNRFRKAKAKLTKKQKNREVIWLRGFSYYLLPDS